MFNALHKSHGCFMYQKAPGGYVWQFTQLAYFCDNIFWNCSFVSINFNFSPPSSGKALIGALYSNNSLPFVPTLCSTFSYLMNRPSVHRLWRYTRPALHQLLQNRGRPLNCMCLLFYIGYVLVLTGNRFVLINVVAFMISYQKCRFILLMALFSFGSTFLFNVLCILTSGLNIC